MREWACSHVGEDGDEPTAVYEVGGYQDGQPVQLRVETCAACRAAVEEQFALIATPSRWST